MRKIMTNLSQDNQSPGEIWTRNLPSTEQKLCPFDRHVTFDQTEVNYRVTYKRIFSNSELTSWKYEMCIDILLDGFGRESNCLKAYTE